VTSYRDCRDVYQQLQHVDAGPNVLIHRRITARIFFCYNNSAVQILTENTNWH